MRHLIEVKLPPPRPEPKHLMRMGWSYGRSHLLGARGPAQDTRLAESAYIRIELRSNSSTKRAMRASATCLGITEGTVKSHVSTILLRLNVSDRTQAVMAALQSGLARL